MAMFSYLCTVYIYKCSESGLHPYTGSLKRGLVMTWHFPPLIQNQPCRHDAFAGQPVATYESVLPGEAPQMPLGPHRQAGSLRGLKGLLTAAYKLWRLPFVLRPLMLRWDLTAVEISSALRPPLPLQLIKIKVNNTWLQPRTVLFG